MPCDRREKIDSRPCKLYLSPGLCKLPDQFRCIEFVERVSVSLSQTSIKDWWRCHRRYYYSSIRGIQLRPKFQNLPMRQGSEFQRLLANQSSERTYFSPDEELDRIRVVAAYKAIRELNLLPGNLVWERKFALNDPDFINLTGYIDCMNPEENYFGEVKFTGNPSWYQNNFVASYQLEVYFLLTGCKTGYILPVRSPSTKPLREIQEDGTSYGRRILSDILKRPGFYFPEYNESKTPFKFGRKFYAHEYDLENIKRDIMWTADEIRRCSKANRWVQMRNCYHPGQCEYLTICESGEISEYLYEKRNMTRETENIDKREEMIG